MGLIRPKLSDLFALEFAKIAESDFVYSHNIYDNEILDEFIYGSNPTVTSSYLPLSKEKLFNSTLFTL